MKKIAKIKKDNLLEEITEKQYFQMNKLSQSTLKSVMTNPPIYGEKEFVSTPAMDLGSALDLEMLTPEQEEVVIVKLSKEYGESKLNILRTILNTGQTLEEVLAVSGSFYANLKLETRINKFKGDEEDIEMLLEKHKLIQEGEKTSILLSGNQVESLNFMKVRTKELLDRIHDRHSKVGEITKQLCLLFQCRPGVDSKCLLDLVCINRKEKTIQPYDLKSTSFRPIEFEKAIKKFRYDIQAEWYRKALFQNYPGYQVLDMKFIVICSTEDVPGAIYQLTDYTISLMQNYSPNLKCYIDNYLKYYTKEGKLIENKDNIIQNENFCYV